MSYEEESIEYAGPNTPFELEFKNYSDLCELGKGAHAVVYRVKNNIDGKIYVMKKIKMLEKEPIMDEVNILKKLKNNHIIKYSNSFVYEDNFYIITEYAERGDLYSLLKLNKITKGVFSEDEIWDFAYQICLGLQYLHDRNIIHRDIKLLNIFLNKDNFIKIGDLGVSKIIYKKTESKSKVGTPLYLAPEILKNVNYDYKVDIWSLGCSLYQLCSTVTPFYDENISILEDKILHCDPERIPGFYSNDLWQFITILLSKNQENRPYIIDCLSIIPSRIKVK